MSYINPKNTKVAPIEEDGDESALSLAEEILTMEKYKKELVRKYGGDQYNRQLRRLVKKKQEQILK